MSAMRLFDGLRIWSGSVHIHMPIYRNLLLLLLNLTPHSYILYRTEMGGCVRDAKEEAAKSASVHHGPEYGLRKHSIQHPAFTPTKHLVRSLKAFKLAAR